MNVEVSTYQRLQPIIDGIDKSIIITSVSGSAPTWTLLTCNTKWAFEGYPITIGENTYIIRAIVYNVSITIEGEVEPDALIFNLYAPQFYHGTIRSVELELNEKKNDNLLSTDKLPLIWLHEPTPERFAYNDLDSIERRSECELYIMGECNFDQWVTEDHYLKAIRPVRTIVSALLDSISNSKFINSEIIDGFDLRDLPRFGRYTGEAGNKVMFSSHVMSGCSLKITLPFFLMDKDCIC